MERRSTRQKRILNETIAGFNGLFGADQLHEAAQEEDDISLATVYRHLKRREQEHSLFSYTCDGRKVYSTRSRAHCHYTCTDTGKVFHFELDTLDFLAGVVPGTIDSVQIEVSGTCASECGACGR